MATMSIRGLNDQALARLENQAEQEGGSLNSLVLRLLQGTGTPDKPSTLKKYDDLNALAGTWSDEEAQEFERNTAVFAEFDAALDSGLAEGPFILSLSKGRNDKI